MSDFVSAEVCARFLVVGFISFLHILLPKSCYFMTRTCNLAGLVPGIGAWHSGEPLDDPAAPGSMRKETLAFRLGFSTILGGFRGPILKVF